MIILSDDGTLDTVLRCTECGEEMRYNYDGPNPDTIRYCDHSAHAEHCVYCMADAEEQYKGWIAWAIEDASAEHVCRKIE